MSLTTPRGNSPLRNIALALAVTLPGVGAKETVVAQDDVTAVRSSHLPALPYSTNTGIGTLALSDSGLTLLTTTKARPQFDELKSYWNRGQRAPAELVSDFFEIIKNERGTDITPERMKKLLSQHGEPEVQRKILEFIYRSPFISLSDATLEQFWSGKRADVLAMALLNKSKTINCNVPDSFFKELRNDPRTEIRVATALALLSAGKEPVELSCREVVRAAQLLCETHLASGHELRLSKLLEAKLLGVSDEPAKVQSVTGPLLHLLLRISESYPSMLDQIDSHAEDSFDRFCSALARKLIAVREEQSKRTVLDDSTNVLLALHAEDDFVPHIVREFMEKVEVNSFTCIKAGERPNAPRQQTIRRATYPSTSERTKFLKEIAEVSSRTPKADFLEHVGTLCADATSPSLVWVLSHGSPSVFSFYNGTYGRVSQNQGASEEHVSCEELAALLMSKVVVKEGVCNFNHMTFILEACRQYTMAQGSLLALERIAHKRGVTIQGYPTFIVLTQPLMYGNLSGAELVVRRGNEKVGIAESIVSSFQKNLPSDKRSYTLGDFVQASDRISGHLAAQLQDFRRVRGLNSYGVVATNSTVEDSAGRRVLQVNDPAIFAPIPVDVSELLKSVLSEIGIPPHSIPNIDALKVRGFLEISHLHISGDIALT